MGADPTWRATRLPKPPSHGQGSKGRLCPALPRQFPSQAGGHGITAWPGGVWLWESCLETSSLGAKKEQAHPSVLIKTTVRLPPLALGFGQGFTSGIPSRQTCYVPNSGAGKGKRVFTQHRPAKGLLSRICSLQGIRCLSPSEGGGRSIRLCGLSGIYTTLPIKSLVPPSATFSHQTPAAVFSYVLFLCKTLKLVPLLTFHPTHSFISPELSSASGCHPRALSN